VTNRDPDLRPTITADQAADLYADGEGVDGDTVAEWTLVGGTRDHKSRQSRWLQLYWLIVRDTEGATWGLRFGLGLTESQEHDFPWPWYGDSSVPGDRELKLTRLYPHTVTETVYKTKPPADDVPIGGTDG
jgi:hypothetical protein